MKIDKFYKKYKIFVVITTLLTILLTLSADKGAGYKKIYVIPIVYLLLFLFNKSIHKYSKTNFGMFILNTLLYIKYILATLCIVLNKDYGAPCYTGRIPMSDSCESAIGYIVIEMLFIFTTIFIFARKFYVGREKTKKDENNIFTKINYNLPMIAFLGIASLLALKNINIFIPKQIFLINEGYETLGENVPGFLELIYLALKTILMGIIINTFIIKYQKKEKWIYIIGSYIVILIYAILSAGASRINMIMPIVFFALITYSTFGKKGKVLLGIVISILLLSISSITIYKSAWLFKSGDNSLLSVGKVLTSQIQEYTSGIRPIAQGLEAIEVYDKEITLNTLINDLLGSIPVVSKICNANNRINVYYNKYILGMNSKNTPMLIPMVVISKAYFSSVLCWMFSVINIILMMYFDGKEYKGENNFLKRYMIIYLTFIFASSVYGNTQMIIGRIFTRFIPTILIMYFNERIIVRKEIK